MIRRELERLAGILPVETFHGANGPFLSKYTLLDLRLLVPIVKNPRVRRVLDHLVHHEQALQRLDRAGRAAVRLHLHFFHRPDEDAELHNHPWSWGVSLVLAGGYTEERLIEMSERRLIARSPGDLYTVRAETFHRVAEVPEGGCWTLFLSGPVTQTWGFLGTAPAVAAAAGSMLRYTPWRAFIAGKGLTPK